VVPDVAQAKTTKLLEKFSGSYSANHLAIGDNTLKLNINLSLVYKLVD
jgi:hypothetical protein